MSDKIYIYSHHEATPKCGFDRLDLIIWINHSNKTFQIVKNALGGYCGGKQLPLVLLECVLDDPSGEPVVGWQTPDKS